jgi:hypothetical protein
MTATCSSVEIIKHDLCFFMSETSVKDVVYTSTIQCVFEYEIILSLMAYTTTFIMRIRGGKLQSLEVDKNISIPMVRRRDKKHVSFNRQLVGYNITSFNWNFRYEFREYHRLFGFRRNEFQVKILEDNYPSTDFFADDLSCQYILKWIHDENDGGVAKQNIMTEPLDGMNCCQCNFFDMGII